MRRSRVLIPILSAGAVAALFLLWSRNRELEIRVDGFERRALESERLATERATVDAARIARLQEELRQAIEAREFVSRRIEAAREDVLERRQQENDRLRRATAPPPEGVRVALLTLNERLRTDGYPGLRILHAERIEDRALHGVELVEQRADLLTTSLYRADTVRFELDRAAATMTLRCVGGTVFEAGIARTLEEPDGETIELSAVDGPLWESTLPYLVRATGVHADDAEAQDPGIPSVDRATLQVWMERLDALLVTATTEFRYRVGVLRDVRDGAFRDIAIHGYDERKQLATSMRAERLEVLVDESGGVVSLRLHDGVLLRAGGETPIPAEPGYRVLLPGVSVERARELLLGMVRKDGT